MKMQGSETLICVVILCLPLLAGSQFFYPQWDTKAVTAAHFFTGHSGLFQAVANPALISEHRVEAGTCVEKRYMAKELLSFTGAALFNFAPGQLTFSIHHFGSLLFNERAASVGLGKSFGAGGLGAKFTYVESRASPVYRQANMSMAFSSIFQINEEVRTSIYVSDPHYLLKPFANGRFRPSPSIRVGAGYRPSEYFYSGIETEKEQGRRAKIFFTASYQINKEYGARLFWSTGNNQPFAAISWRQRKIILEAGCSYHISLGFSPCFTFSYHQSKSL